MRWVYLNSDFGKLLRLVETKRYARHRKVGFGAVKRHMRDS